MRSSKLDYENPTDSMKLSMQQQSARHLSSKKLLLSKWTATTPRNKEKHFIVTKVIQTESPAIHIENIELEAVYSRRSVILPWRELADVSLWQQGWK